MRVTVGRGASFNLVRKDPRHKATRAEDHRRQSQAKAVTKSVRGKLRVHHGRRRRRGIPDFLINVDTEGSHYDRYDNRHHSTGFYIRRVGRMVEFLQIAHFFLLV
jgi:hypothetical protein